MNRHTKERRRIAARRRRRNRAEANANAWDHQTVSVSLSDLVEMKAAFQAQGAGIHVAFPMTGTMYLPAGRDQDAV